MPSKDRESSSRWRLLLTLLPAVLAAAALAPASAMAQDGGGGSGDRCTARVAVTQDERVAAIEVDCGDTEIDNVRIDPTDQGTIDANAGTTCEHIGNDVYRCSPEGSGSSISVRFNDEAGPVCADPRLIVDFTVTLATDTPEPETETIDNVEASGCANFTPHVDSDSGLTPEGGVDSGGGGAAPTRTTPPLPVIAFPVLAVALAGTALALRRRVS